ncbi:MAG: hypothetical protein B7Y99_04910 [Caulobacterales bacterium 32-69-10]|nr:MAG: hypothetical protein B7Y99_04910 [Caulobacterales bacterium 32-69-10]
MALQTVIDTDIVALRDRSAYYRDETRALFGSCDLRVDAGQLLSSRIEVAALADLTITRCTRATGLSVYRTPSNIRLCEREVVDLLWVRAGQCTVIQAGNEARLGPGDAALLVSTRPYEIHKPLRGAEMDILEVSIPLARLQHVLDRPELLSARRLSNGAMVGMMAESLVRSTSGAPDEVAAQAADSLILALDVIAHEMIRSTADTIHGAAALQPLMRAKAHALSRLGDFDLDRDEIARAAGMSVRHLNRLFGRTGDSVTQLVRTLRLERAAEMLTDPACEGLTIQEVAARCGYADQSQFCRHFKRQYGRTATSYRRPA